jgi:hypothetical protein
MSARALLTVAVGISCVLGVPALGQAQGIGIGPRITFVRGGDGSPDGAQRFSGGALRLGSGRAALEIAMDFRSDSNSDLTERIKDYPIQTSLLIYPVRSKLAPYLLGGVGWYSQRVETLGPVVSAETTRKMGYHAGFGGELRVHRHVGLYGDYRYTFIRFGEDDAEPVLPSFVPFGQRLKLAHEGSAFTWGASFYF